MRRSSFKVKFFNNLGKSMLNFPPLVTSMSVEALESMEHYGIMHIEPLAISRKMVLCNMSNATQNATW